MGDCWVTASQPGNALYHPASSVSSTVKLLKSQDQIFSYGTFPVNLYGYQFPYSFTFSTYSKQIPIGVSYSKNICDFSENQLQILLNGRCAVSFYTVDTELFIGGATGIVWINLWASGQVLSFSPNLDGTSWRLIDGTSTVTTISSTSGLRTEGYSMTNLICTYDGTNLIFLTAGTCKIRGFQRGNGAWYFADVYATIEVYDT